MNDQVIQWFPGHMAKTRRKIKESLSLADAVAEIVDARIPLSSRNPEINELVGDKPRIVLLNKCDMADSSVTAQWVKYYKDCSVIAIPVDCRSGNGLNKFKTAVFGMLDEKLEYYRSKGMVGRKIRVMVVGIPNVGKSSFINRLCKNAKAKVENRPGVTRGNQWFPADDKLELLDTPGVLWPKFDDQTVGERLAYTGAVKDSVLDIETLAVGLISVVKKDYMSLLTARYGITENGDSYEMLQDIGRRRGMMQRGGVVDCERAANMLIEEFRSCKIGRISLELPEVK